MATLAAIFKRSEGNVVAAEEPRENWDWAPDPCQLRPFPSEDVYFYCKKVDNSRVRRESDPLALRKCWHAATIAFAASLFVMILMLPDALGMIAGYQIDTLSREHARMLRDRGRLELEEATLLSPQRLQELARDLRLVDPDSAHIVYLNSGRGGALALNAPRK
jgi:cell division protein FtsL